jgi:hypothetical protein
MRRPEHPLIVALVESYAEQIRVPRSDLWAALDGKPTSPELVRGLVAAFEPLVRESDFVLASRKKSVTLGTMSTSPAEPAMAAPRRGRPIKTDHPLLAALKRAGVSVVDEATAVRRSPASVRSFCTSEEANYRPIPRAIAERWLKVYGVPLATWPRIAD